MQEDFPKFEASLGYIASKTLSSNRNQTGSESIQTSCKLAVCFIQKLFWVWCCWCRGLAIMSIDTRVVGKDQILGRIEVSARDTFYSRMQKQNVTEFETSLVYILNSRLSRAALWDLVFKGGRRVVKGSFIGVLSNNMISEVVFYCVLLAGVGGEQGLFWFGVFVLGAVVMFLPPNFIQLWCTMCPNIHTQCIGGDFQADRQIHHYTWFFCVVR